MRLNGLPLALATVGSYLDQVSVSVAEYLDMYETSWAQFHEKDPGLASYDCRRLHSTWQMSLERIRQRNEHSVRLIGLWCYFSSQDLWFELLCSGRTSDLPGSSK